MPRGDMQGLATFLDRKNRLLGEVIFGKVQGKEDEPLLQRSDSVRTGVYEATFPETPRAASPPVRPPPIRIYLRTAGLAWPDMSRGPFVGPEVRQGTQAMSGIVRP